MSANSVRRAALAGSALSLAFFVAACGGDSKGADVDAGSTVKAMTAAELEKVVLVQGDVKGHEVEERDTSADEVTVDKPECAPFGQVVSGVPMESPSSSVQRVIIEEPKGRQKMPSGDELAEMTEKEVEDMMYASMDSTKTMMSLSSYDGTGAEETLASLRTAAEKCGDGFTVTADGEKQTITKIVAEDMSGGDEALAWTVSTKVKDAKADTKVAVVRQDGTVAGFAAWNVAAVGAGKDYEQPSEVIDAQAAKLG